MTTWNDQNDTQNYYLNHIWDLDDSIYNLVFYLNNGISHEIPGHLADVTRCICF